MKISIAYTSARRMVVNYIDTVNSKNGNLFACAMNMLHKLYVDRREEV